jgi:phosphohistidine swiveling domain-containing protein
MLRGYMEAGDDGSPEARLRRQLEVRSSAERRVLEGLAGRPWRRRSFEAQYSLVKKYCWWREETRVYLSRARYQTRRFLLELDYRWLEQGLIEKPGDVFWMERDTLLGLLSGTVDPAEAREQVRRHRRTAVLYRKFTPPLIIGPAATAETRGGLNGVGCSPGIGEGPARILRDLGDAHTLRRGDVLVALHANPAWTPLFSLAAAVVLEEGGLLSHCAVVAREMGVPVVVQVGRATDLIPPGCPLRVDGHRGTVERLDGKDPEHA